MRVVRYLCAVAVALGCIAPARAATYAVLHRVSSFDASADWTVRGTLTVSTNGSTFVNAVDTDGVSGLQALAVAPDARDQFYQLSIQQGQGDVMTSIPLCHLRQSHPDLARVDDTLTVTTRSDRITNLAYRINDITLDPTCPLASTKKLEAQREERRKERQKQLAKRSNRGKSIPVHEQPPHFNTKVFHVEPIVPPSPQLKQAMPTNDDGSVQTPVPEKTFLQKYWFYLIPIAILLILPPGEDDPKPTPASNPAPSK